MRSLLLLLSFALVAVGQEPCPEGQAKCAAALALAKAKREREAGKQATGPSCHKDAGAALAEAKRTGKPLVYWVGVTCEENAALRNALDAAVHCHLSSYDGFAIPRVVIADTDGREVFHVLRGNIGPA